MGNKLQNLGKNYSEQNQEHKLQVKELPDEPQNFTCEICIEPMLLPNKKFKNQILCVHPFCTDCIIKYITIKLEDNIGNIRCPSLNCPYLLDPILCRNIVGPELFVKWCDVLCESAVLGLAHCYCPNQNCSALILDECGGKVKQSKCPNCKKLFCFKCKIPWHASLRCRQVNDAVFREVAKHNKWKRCPRCRYFVERIQGCKFIYCRCGVIFCYDCGRRVRDEINGHSCSCVSPLSRFTMEFVVPSVIILVLFFVMLIPVFIS